MLRRGGGHRGAGIAATTAVLLTMAGLLPVGEISPTLASTTGAYATSVLADAPVAYWRLGEASGTVATDSSAAGANPGTYLKGVGLGRPGALTSEVDTAAFFDGNDDSVSVPDSNALDLTAGATVEAWVKRSKSGASQLLVGKPGSSQSKQENYSLWIDASNQPVAFFGNGSSFVRVASGAPIDQNWHHVVATYGSGVARIYVDNVLRNTANSTLVMAGNAKALSLGKPTGGQNGYGGLLDEVAVYATALSEDRISAHFTSASATDSSAPTVTLTTPAPGSSTTDTTPTFAGTAGNAIGDDTSVTVRIYSGAAATGTPVQTLFAPRSGTSYSIDASVALAGGQYTAQAQQSDAAGNSGVSGANTFTITVDPGADTTPPVVTLAQPANGSSTADTTPTFSGTASAGPGDLAAVTVRVFAGSTAAGSAVQSLNATRQADGTYTVDAAAPLAAGTYTGRAEQADTAGNVGLSGANVFTVTSPTTGTGYRDRVMADAPVAYWRLDETSGTTAADETGSNPGTFNGGPVLGQPGALAAEPASTSVAFDGVNDYVLAADTSSLDMTAGVSVEAWVKRTKSGVYQVVVGKPGNGQSKYENYSIWINTSNKAVAYFGDGTSYVSVSSAGTLDTNWHHLVATYDNATARMYVDGQLSSSANSNIRLTANAGPLNLGRANDNAYYFGGSLDEVAIYRVPLTATQVRTHYSGESTGGGTASPVTLSTPAAATSTADTTPAFAGMADTAPGDATSVTLKLYGGSAATGTPVQTLAAPRLSTGVWGVSAATALAEGTYTAQAEQVDGSGTIDRSTANTFTVGARAASSDPVLVGAGDIAHCSSPGDEATAALLVQLPSATVFTLGDNAYEYGTATEFANCYEPSWGQVKARTRPSLADHDYGDGRDRTAAGYFGYFRDQLSPFGAAAGDPTRGYYSYNLGAWHVVHLNAACGYSTAGSACHAAQLSWLESDLASNPAPCTVAMLHAPRFSSGTIHGNNESMGQYWDVLYNRHVDLVLSGDDHVYERFAPQNPQGAYDPTRGLRQIIVGTGGRSHYSFASTIQPNSEVRNETTFGVLKLALHAAGYEWDFLPESGKTFQDSGSAACH